MVTPPGTFKRWMVENNRAAHQAIERELQALGLDLRDTAIDYLLRKKISVSGAHVGGIIGTIDAVVRKELEGCTLYFGSNAEHAIFVHEGTRPHWAPIKPLKRWVFQKLGMPVTPGKSGNLEGDRVAYAVQRSIAKKGTKAKPFLLVALRLHRDKMQARINAAVEEALRAS